jgi:hypothetical protein
VLPLLTNADLRSYPVLNWFGLKGQYADLNGEWYLSIGPQIIVTMIILTLKPYMSFLTSFSMRFFNKWRDTGFSCCPNYRDNEQGFEDCETKIRDTKVTTVYKYL